MLKHKLVDFIIQFMEEVDKEISEMKLFVSLPSMNYNPLVSQPLVECSGKICRRVLLNTGEFSPKPP
jgi:hypothetical protein